MREYKVIRQALLLVSEVPLTITRRTLTLHTKLKTAIDDFQKYLSARTSHNVMLYLH